MSGEIKLGIEYEIDHLEAVLLNIPVARDNENGHQADWYRVPSWRVRFKAPGFDVFDFRINKDLRTHDGWVLTEATTGLAAHTEEDCGPELPCLMFACKIQSGAMTAERVHSAMAKARATLASMPPLTPQALRWRPHTEQPLHLPATAVVVAPRGCCEPHLSPAVYHMTKYTGGQWENEDTGVPLQAPEFWWLPEEDVLACLPPEARKA